MGHIEANHVSAGAQSSTCGSLLSPTMAIQAQDAPPPARSLKEQPLPPAVTAYVGHRESSNRTSVQRDESIRTDAINSLKLEQRRAAGRERMRRWRAKRKAQAENAGLNNKTPPSTVSPSLMNKRAASAIAVKSEQCGEEKEGEKKKKGGTGMKE